MGFTIVVGKIPGPTEAPLIQDLVLLKPQSIQGRRAPSLDHEPQTVSGLILNYFHFSNSLDIFE